MIKDRHSKVNVLVISVLISTAILTLHTQLSSKAFAQDNNWYVGEGVTKDTYVKYRISHFDTNNGREFEMMIYFKEQDDKGRSAYANSLQWLAAYVAKPGQSLSAGSWGKIGSIGGSEIKPTGNQELSIPAFPEPVDTKKVEYYKANRYSTMYILNEFPYPVMAKTYVDVTTGSPPIQFQFILTETGKGEPEIPQATVLEVTPPLLQRTERGDYYIQLDWTPITISAGEETTFTIDILDKDQFPANQASYNLLITSANNTSLLDLKNQLAREGTNSHTMTFEQPGVINVKVKVNSVQGVESGLFIEEAEFQIPVK